MLSVADSVDRGCFEAIGIVDPAKLTSLPFPVLGADDALSRLFESGYSCAFISLGSMGDTAARVRLCRTLETVGFSIIKIIDPSALVSASAAIEPGVYIGKGVMVNALCDIKRMAILNTGCIVEHQCAVGDFAHIAPGAKLLGNVSVGAHTHIGAGSVIKQGCSIGEGTVIGMGSVVMKDIEPGVIAYGNPCEVVRRKENKV